MNVNNKSKLIKRLYFAVIVVFGIGLCLFVALAVECSNCLSNLRSSAGAINLAGRQRALSQRITNLAGYEVSRLDRYSDQATASGYFGEIAKCKEAMRIEYGQVKRFVADFRVDPTQSNARDCLENTEKHRSDFLEVVEKFIAKADVGEPEELRACFYEMHPHSELFFPKMDRAVAAIQRNRQSEVRAMQTSIFRLFGIFGIGFVAFVGLFVIRHIKLARQEINQSLAESERFKQLAMIAEKSTNAAVFTDPMSRIVWVNHGFTRITGYSLDEVVGKVPGHFLQCDETCSDTIERMRIAVRNRQNFNGEILNQAKNGNRYWLNIDLQPCHDENGVLTGFVAIETDITERKRNQADLEASTLFLQSAIDSISSHIAILDEHGTILYVNSHWKRFAQENDYRGSDFGIGSNYLTITERDARAGGRIAADVGHGIQNVMSGEVELFEYEYPCDSPTEVRWFLMCVSRFDCHGKVRLVVSHQNITERKLAQLKLLDLNTQLTVDLNARIQAEEKLRTANTYLDVYRKIVDHHAIVAETDTTGTIVAVNEAFCKISGYARHELVGQNHRILNSGLHPKSMWKEMYKTAANGGFWHGEICNRSKSGKRYWVDTTIAPLFDEANKIRGYFAIRADITSLKQAQSQAESASRSKSEFLANMSHEIRTPMTAILGYADILAESLKDGIDTVEATDHINTIKRNGEHLLSIINDILDISKIEADKMTAEKIKVSPLQVVRDVVELMKVKSQPKGLKLELQYEDSIPPTITTDPTRLRQILVNLVGNAIKFTDVGSVTVSVRFDEQQPELILFDIIDTGIGLSEEQMGRLFQSFEQVDSSMARKFGGTGLGLQISKRLAAILGGDINVSCKVGGGCVFSASVATGNSIGADDQWSLPSSNSTESGPSNTAKLHNPSSVHPSQPPVPQAPLPLDGSRILLVEDGPDNQRLIAFHLKKAGAAVTIAEHGRVALDLIARQDPPFDMVFMDMQMPVMDGYETTRHLRSAGLVLPIVALTAHAMEGERKKCLEAGCDDYATKPIDSKMIIEIAKRYVAHSRLSTKHAISVSDFAGEATMATACLIQ